MNDVVQASLFAQALTMDKGALFSDCKRYRYLLWRTWDASKGNALFIMLNPSTADGETNDPTVERCQRRATQWGYGGLVVANIFALRSTDPAGLYPPEMLPIQEVGRPFHNDVVLRTAAKGAQLVVCGWGEHGALHRRGSEVLSLLRRDGVRPHALRMNKSGQPQHPLYIGYKVQPFPIP